MEPVILSGRTFARGVRKGIGEKVSSSGSRPPGLAVLVVGDDPASEVYVSMKEKACKRAGIVSRIEKRPSSISEEELLSDIRRLNLDGSIDGILCQLPLPDHISEDIVASAIDPDKDVDGFHPENVGKLWRGESGFVPCTPLGIVNMLKEYGIPLDGSRAVIIGRSLIVGKPMAALLLREHCTVTIAHSHTDELPALCREADILVAAVGRPGFVTADFIKPGATVVDVGISRTDEGLSGDVDFHAALQVCGAITPVPGGVGPLTIAFLLSNTIQAWESHLGG